MGMDETGAGSSGVRVEKSGAVVGTRGGINLIPGLDIELTVTDDAANDEVDVTVTSTASGGSGGAAPDTKTGLSAWFNPDDLDATLADRDPVTSWADSTGAVTVSQGTGANQPTFLADAISSADALRFDGADWLTAGNNTDLDIGTSDFTVIAVVRDRDTGNQDTICGKDFTRWELWIQDGIVHMYVGGTANQLVFDEPLPRGGLGIVVVRRSGSTVEGFLGKLFAGSVTNSAGATGTHPFRIGERSSGTGFALSGILGDIAVWTSTALAQADWHDVVEFFAAKWGVSV